MTELLGLLGTLPIFKPVRYLIRVAWWFSVVLMCMHVQVFSSSAILVLHAYMHGAAASSLEEPPLTWRVLWIAQQVQNLPHGVLESVQGATVEPGSWVFQPMLTDIDGGLLRIRKADLGILKWICERLVLLSWEQVRFHSFRTTKNILRITSGIRLISLMACMCPMRWVYHTVQL